MYFVISRQSTKIAVHLNKIQMSMLKMSTTMISFGRKRFVNFLSSRKSYNLSIVCKMTVWLGQNFFVKNICRFDRRCNLCDRKRDQFTFCIIVLSTVSSWSEQRWQNYRGKVFWYFQPIKLILLTRKCSNILQYMNYFSPWLLKIINLRRILSLQPWQKQTLDS